MKKEFVSATLVMMTVFTSTVAQAEDHTFGNTLIQGGNHHPASIALACIWGQDYEYGRYKRKKNDPRGHDLAGHEFRSKPAFITKSGNETIITGEIVHVLHGTGVAGALVGAPAVTWGRKDDVMKYEIKKVDNKIISIKRDVNRGGYGVVAGPFTALINVILGTDLSPEKAKELTQATETLIEGKGWEVAADAIILNIAVLAK